MFAALILARAGAKPILSGTRQSGPRQRQRDVENFGTAVILIPIPTFSSARGRRRYFSDGKLMTGIKRDRYTAEVFNSLVAAGAPA